MPEFHEQEVAFPKEVTATAVVHETFDRGVDLQRTLSVKQVAHWLRVGENEVTRMAVAGEIPGKQAGDNWRFGVLALNKWIEGNTNEPDPLAEPLARKLHAVMEAWSSLEAQLGKVLEPIIGTSVTLASEGGISFGGELVTLAQLEMAYILHVLAKHGGNKAHAARVLGIDLSTLYRKLKDYQ